MRILVSNDDGILAPGLRALATAMREFGDVTVVGPEENQSANGHRKTLSRPLRINKVNIGEDVEAYSINGSPADCVAMAVLGVIKQPIDMVVSGINRGANLGQDLTYSGTVAAAFEATIQRRKAVAFSLDNPSLNADYSAAAQVARMVVREVIQNGLPPMTLLNVNVPNLPYDQIKGVKITRQGIRVYRDRLDERFDPMGQPYYWIAGDAPTGDVTLEGTDIWAIHNGFASVTPVQLDLTAHTLIDSLRSWQFN
jgi:5'-nucleotidase